MISRRTVLAGLIATPALAKAGIAAEQTFTLSVDELPSHRHGWIVDGPPVGTIQPMWEPLPPGWIVGDGRELRCIDYQDLFSAIGHTFGPSASPHRFRLPDMRGSSPIWMVEGGKFTPSKFAIFARVEWQSR